MWSSRAKNASFKLALLISAILLLHGDGHAQQAPQEDPFAPQLSEFYSPLRMEYKGLFSGRKNQQSQQAQGRYWVQRKEALNNEINDCQQGNTAKMACYKQIRQVESQKTDSYINGIYQGMDAEQERKQALFQTAHTIPIDYRCNIFGASGSCYGW